MFIIKLTNLHQSENVKLITKFYVYSMTIV